MFGFWCCQLAAIRVDIRVEYSCSPRHSSEEKCVCHAARFPLPERFSKERSTCSSCERSSRVAAHGHTIAEVIERTSENALEIEQGSLYPALHRLEDRGLLASEWGLSENNRKAKFYRLTPKGRKRLTAETARWRQMTRAIGLILGEVK